MEVAILYNNILVRHCLKTVGSSKVHVLVFFIALSLWTVLSKLILSCNRPKHQNNKHDAILFSYYETQSLYLLYKYVTLRKTKTNKMTTKIANIIQTRLQFKSNCDTPVGSVKKWISIFFFGLIFVFLHFLHSLLIWSKSDSELCPLDYITRPDSWVARTGLTCMTSLCLVAPVYIHI